jgi:hypothetical protein
MRKLDMLWNSPKKFIIIIVEQWLTLPSLLHSNVKLGPTPQHVTHEVKAYISPT